MADDTELLQRYASDKSEEAFAGLVRQHLGLVYQSALRRLNGDVHGAQDVSQVVFTDLARRAPSLIGLPSLAGWLHARTRHAALHHLRTERRRRDREQEAHLMQESIQPSDPSADWTRLRPVIDDALDTLKPGDRDAVLMRFFEGRDFAQMGTRLQLSEEGARLRVNRALEKLQPLLARRGITSTTGALALALGSQAALGAPAGLAPVVAVTALSASTVGTGLSVSLGTLGLVKASTLILAGSLAANAILGTIYFRKSEAAKPPMESRTTNMLAETESDMRKAGPAGDAAFMPLDAVAIGRRLQTLGFSDRAVASGARAVIPLQFPAEFPNSNRATRITRWNRSPQALVTIAPGLFPPEPLNLSALQRNRIESVLGELGYDGDGRPKTSQ